MTIVLASSCIEPTAFGFGEEVGDCSKSLGVPDSAQGLQVPRRTSVNLSRTSSPSRSWSAASSSTVMASSSKMGISSPRARLPEPLDRLARMHTGEREMTTGSGLLPHGASSAGNGFSRRWRDRTTCFTPAPPFAVDRSHIEPPAHFATHRGSRTAVHPSTGPLVGVAVGPSAGVQTGYRLRGGLLARADGAVHVVHPDIGALGAGPVNEAEGITAYRSIAGPRPRGQVGTVATSRPLLV